jgi:hypothetical protein
MATVRIERSKECAGLGVTSFPKLFIRQRDAKHASLTHEIPFSSVYILPASRHEMDAVLVSVTALIASVSIRFPP